MSLKSVLVAGIAAVAISGAASAQDWSLNPTFGSVSLNAGFMPDPYTVSITAGGTIDARSASGGQCQGMIANAPDFRLYYGAGSLPLYLGARSDRDTTLVVNGPDGSWYCDDDSGDGLNPLIYFSRPMSGQYDIWIGTYGTNSGLANSVLTISEIGG